MTVFALIRSLIVAISLLALMPEQVLDAADVPLAQSSVSALRCDASGCSTTSRLTEASVKRMPGKAQNGGTIVQAQGQMSPDDGCAPVAHVLPVAVSGMAGPAFGHDRTQIVSIAPDGLERPPKIV